MNESEKNENDSYCFERKIEIVKNLLEETTNQIEDTRYQVEFYDANNEPYSRQDKLLSLYYNKKFLERLLAGMLEARD